MSTLVQVKRSTANAIPASLQAGELAYSYASNVLFIGTNANTVINIGGKTYTDLLDNGSAANGASTFVRRYANGSAQFQQLDILVSPTANSHVATKAYVDGALTGNISLNTLTDVIVTGTAADQNNRILIGHANGQYITTGVTGNVSISNTGVVTIGAQQVVGSMLNDTLAGNKTFSDTITIGKDLNVTGNLNVLGNTVTVNVETLSVEDSLIKLANNNTTDVVDIGFYGVYNSTTYAGLFRDATDNRFKLFTGYTGSDPSGNVMGAVARAMLEANLDAQIINVTSLGVQTLIANAHTTLTSANLSGSLNVATDATIAGDLAVNGGDLTTTSATFNLVNGTATTLNIGGAATTVEIGAPTGLTNINNSLEVDGDLTVDGGDIITPTATMNVVNTNATTVNFAGAATTLTMGATNGAVVTRNNLNVAETSRANTFVSTRTAVQGPSLSNFNGERLRLFDFNTVGRPNYAIGVEGSHIWLGVDSSANTEGWKFYGNTSLAARLSANGVLEVANSIITSYVKVTTADIGTLTLTNPLGVSSGGTGRSSFVANGVAWANSTSSLTFATGTEGQVLQIDAGVPAFAMLDGGSF